MVHANPITNCHITLDNISTSNIIFGRKNFSLKRKTFRRQPKTVVLYYVGILRWILETNKKVSIAPDEIFVNGLIFVVSISRNINLTMANHVGKRTKGIFSKSLKHNYFIYAKKCL